MPWTTGRQVLSPDALGTIFSRLGLEALDLNPDPVGFYRASYDVGRNPIDLLEAVLDDSSVATAYLDTYLKFFGDPSDRYYSRQWNLRKARVDRAWEITAGSDDVIVAVLDRGVETGHEDFEGTIWVNAAEDINHNGTFENEDSASGGDLNGRDDDHNGKIDDVIGWDFKSGDNDPRPSIEGDEHGTAVAGIVCAARDNELGIAGVAGGDSNGRTKIVPIRVNTQGDVSPAIHYAWRLGVDFINMSFGGNTTFQENVSAAIDSAHAHGVLSFAASGNLGSEYVFFPASDPNVVAVGSTDQDDVHICSSSYGSQLDVVAPSGSKRCQTDSLVWTTDNYSLSYSYNPGYYGCQNCLAVPSDNDRYFGGFDGTSSASPFAVGVAALIKAHMPGLTATEVRERLLASAIDLGDPGFDVEYGNGRVDGYRALTEWGTISEDATWRPEDTADSTRYVSGDLTVAAGATLTIMPGTIIKIANDDDLEDGVDHSRIEINVEGTLVADGTAANPIVFESWHPTTTEDWVGFYFDDQSGGGTFDHCVIKRAEYAIESYVALSVTNTGIDTCRYVGVLSQAGGALVQGCTLTSPGSFGIFLTTDSTVVRNTVVNEAVGTALNVQLNAAARIRNSQFLGSNWGLFHRGTSHAADIDSSCTFQGNDIGLNFFEAGPTSTVRGSSIDQNTFGIWCEDASPLITLSQITSGAIGVVTSGTSQPDIGHYPSTGGNKFGFNGYHVYNDGAYTVYAQNNCWNRGTSPCGPTQSEIYGSVLTTSPQCCTIGQAFTYTAQPEPSLPRRTSLSSIVPNPFNPTTAIHYDVATAANVEIRVYDVGGRLVRELVKKNMSVGSYHVVWNGIDGRGQPMASGIYFVRMIAGGERFTKKMVLLK